MEEEDDEPFPSSDADNEESDISFSDYEEDLCKGLQTDEVCESLVLYNSFNTLSSAVSVTIPPRFSIHQSLYPLSRNNTQTKILELKQWAQGGGGGGGLHLHTLVNLQLIIVLNDYI